MNPLGLSLFGSSAFFLPSVGTFPPPGLPQPLFMDSVVTREMALSSSMAETRIVCRICQKQFAQYTCPRCNSRYCSLACYKGHNLRCTESFMRENVEEEMRNIRPEDETKKKMMDILKRFHSEEETEYEEEDDSPLSEETIMKFLSGIDVKLEDLSDEEIKQFHRAVASGRLSKMIEPWEPWWLKPSARTISLSQDGTQLVRVVNEHVLESSSQDTIESSLCEIPAGPESPLPSLSKLSQAEPSPLLAVHLVDVLYTYCFTLRLYNGDYHSDPAGAATIVLTISSVLGENFQPETVAEALSNCLEETCSPVFRDVGGFQFGLGLIDDVSSLLSVGNNAMICLLCDLRRLILAGERMLKSEKVGKAKKDVRKKLRSAERKMYFLMCWVHEQSIETWSYIESMLRAEKASLTSVKSGFKRSKMTSGEESKANFLIKEVYKT